MSTFAKPAALTLLTLMCMAITTVAPPALADDTATPPATHPVQNEVQTLIDNHRRILSLANYSTGAGLTHDQRQEASRIGEYLFVEDQRLSNDLTEKMLKHPANAADIDDLLGALANPALKDADLFSLRPVLTEMAKKATLNADQSKQLRNLLKQLQAAHRKYGLELSGALSQAKITKAERPAWAAYLADVEQQFPATAVLDALKSNMPTAAQQVTPSTKTDDVVAEARQNEWFGNQFEKGDVLITFDDGPHPVYTHEILQILARYKVKAIFFQLGQNLGTVASGHAELTKNEEVEKEILAAGHAIGNHSFTHPLLPKLDQTQVEQEIDKTQALLNLVITDDAQRTHMFRAPYGARNAMILGEVGERGLRSVLWNVDSLDWSDPVPESIVHRILQELDKTGRGIILMHDIHPKTVIALPILLDELIKRGYRFVNWEGGKLVPTDRTATDQPSTELIAPAPAPAPGPAPASAQTPPQAAAP